MQPSVFTGKIRHLGLGILMWFVAQGFEFITLYFVAQHCWSVLLSSLVYEDCKRQKQIKAKYFPHIKAESKQSPESDRQRGEKQSESITLE